MSFLIHFRRKKVCSSNKFVAGGLDSSFINPGLKAGAELSRPFRPMLQKNKHYRLDGLST